MFPALFCVAALLRPSALLLPLFDASFLLFRLLFVLFLSFLPLDEPLFIIGVVRQLLACLLLSVVVDRQLSFYVRPFDVFLPPLLPS